MQSKYIRILLLFVAAWMLFISPVQARVLNVLEVSKNVPGATFGLHTIEFQLWTKFTGGVKKFPGTNPTIWKAVPRVRVSGVSRSFTARIPLGGYRLNTNQYQTGVWLFYRIQGTARIYKTRLESVSSALNAQHSERADFASRLGGKTLAQIIADPALKGPAGPQGATGPQGPQGPIGLTGPAGSPDTAAQVKAKLVTVDGAGSGVDADLLDGLNSTAFAAAAHTHANYVLKTGGTMTGSLGIGGVTTADLGVTGQKGVLFSGTFSIFPGALPATGAGSRMMWLPEFGAFRAGRILAGPKSTAWDKANIGIYSTAMGYDTTASGGGATAMGGSTTASGGNATAMGGSTIASGSNATAMGNGTTASGGSATAMGSGTTASGSDATAMGALTTASALASTAMGWSTTASSFYSTAMGVNTTASGQMSTSMGRLTIASGDRSTAMGDTTTAPSFSETVVGAYNTTYTPLSATAWNASDRLFVIGNGRFGTPADAMVVLKNGNTGIGTAAPTALLSVNGTANKPGGGTWGVFSDERLKDIKGNYNAGLDAVMKLQPIVYHYKQDNPLHLPYKPEYIGFSAQALQKVIPQAVDMTSAGYLEVNSDPVFWTMLNAIKELKQQKDKEMAARDAQIAVLKAENLRLSSEQKALAGKVEMLVRAVSAGNVAFSGVEQK